PAAPPRPVPPVLAFPEAGLDDSAAYQGYRTRFFRDSRGNTVQLYVDGRSGRAVQVWADAADESIGFTARDADGRPAELAWGSAGAAVSDSGRFRTIEYRLTTASPTLEIGWLQLGSMRVERDLQYARRHLAPFGAPPFEQPELTALVANVARFAPSERRTQLALLGAPSVEALRARLQPALALRATTGRTLVRVTQPTLDGRNRLVLELGVDPRDASLALHGRTITIRSRAGRPIGFTVRTATDARALSALGRREIFNREFLAFLDQARTAHDSVLRAASARPPGAADSATLLRYRRLEREVRAVELLSSEEKLMAGLPNYATYFGRDMMMTALMMRPVWLPAMEERVIAAVLGKLSPTGQVSHEEALGGQAIRENAGAYDSLVADHFRLARQGGGNRRAADSVLARARAVLRDLQAVPENYHMMDGEFQLPVLVARYLGDPAVPAGRKRAFLLERPGGGPTRLALLMRELDYLAALTAPYAASPTALNLVSFPKRDSAHWRSASWRDSNAGYANGRFAMDINAVWAPQALAATERLLSALRAMGLLERASRGSDAPLSDGPSGALQAYVRDSSALRRAVETWSGARRHFVVALAPREIDERVSARLAALPDAERRFWEKVVASTAAGRDSLVFLALSLDASGRPIPVVNSDPATLLFLASPDDGVARGTRWPETVLRDLDTFMRPYPVGLFVEGLGPLVANDAYASRDVWEAFAADSYHSPRVVWGREVNLLLLGLARQRALASDSASGPATPATARYVHALDEGLRRTLAATEASGFSHAELWSYRVDGGRLLPARYGISSDLQLWSSADLAVQFMLSRLASDRER
ncbi:MAG: hypothetical protein ACJ79S_01150, partial [Gemmatimonadaceae bacterium]